MASCTALPEKLHTQDFYSYFRGCGQDLVDRGGLAPVFGKLWIDEDLVHSGYLCAPVNGTDYFSMP